MQSKRTGQRLTQNSNAVVPHSMGSLLIFFNILNFIIKFLDWRKYGVVSSVKFQGYYCGSCWAFAAAGALEGQYLINKQKNNTFLKNTTSFSAQQLVDCNIANFGCNGGDFGNGLQLNFKKRFFNFLKNFSSFSIRYKYCGHSN